MRESEGNKFTARLGGLFLFLFLSTGVAAAKEGIRLGFVQLSHEGAWEISRTRSIKESAEREGIYLTYRECSNYSNQIEEMRKLVAAGVELLAFYPSQENGWDEVLKGDKDAGIPVIVFGQKIKVADDALYLAYIGSDMVGEGRRAAYWLLEYTEKQKRGAGEVKVVVLEGTKDSVVALDRDRGFREVLGRHPNYKIVRSEPADYIFSKGTEVMMGFLAEEAGNIDVVFAHNDEMALGAIEAVKKYGKNPGQDIVIIGMDATTRAFEAMVIGEMNCSIECSPLVGPQLMQAARDITAGKAIPREIITTEQDYDQTNAFRELPNRTY